MGATMPFAFVLMPFSKEFGNCSPLFVGGVCRYKTDAIPAAWPVRFGRTVTDQVVDAVMARFEIPQVAGIEVTLAGKALPA